MDLSSAASTRAAVDKIKHGGGGEVAALPLLGVQVVSLAVFSLPLLMPTTPDRAHH